MTAHVLKFEIPPGTPASACRSCGAMVFWITTEAGKQMPADPGGESHFASCPQGDKWRKPKPAKASRGAETVRVAPLDPEISSGRFKAYRRTDGAIAIVDTERPLGKRTVRLVQTEDQARTAVSAFARAALTKGAAHAEEEVEADEAVEAHQRKAEGP